MTTRTTPIRDDNRPNNDDRNAQSLIRVALVLAVSLFLASLFQKPFVAPVLQWLLLVSAAASAAGALISHERPWTRYLTRWNEAAVLALAGIIAGVFIDPASVAHALGTAASAAASKGGS